MKDEDKITAIAMMAAVKMTESKIPSTASYDVAVQIFKELKEKGASLPPGFTAALTVKIKALLK